MDPGEVMGTLHQVRVRNYVYGPEVWMKLRCEPLPLCERSVLSVWWSSKKGTNYLYISVGSGLGGVIVILII